MGERANSKAEQVYGAVKEAILSGDPRARRADRQAGAVRAARRVALSRFGGDQPARVRAAGARRAAARLVRRAHFGARTCASGCSSAARSKARSPPRRRGGSGGGHDGAGTKICARRQRPREAGDRARFYALDVAFHAILTSNLGLDRCGEIARRRARASRAGAPPADDAAGPHAGDDRRARARSSKGSPAGDPARARAAMEAHMAAMTALFEEFSRARPELFTA